MEIVIGTAAGMLAAIICTAFYTKGLRYGAKVSGAKRTGVQKQEAPETGKELERKFDAILDYDPYSVDARGREQGDSV